MKIVFNNLDELDKFISKYNNLPDYENDLVFPPKSADDLNKQERQSDVLISTIDKCEMLEKQLFVAKCALENYANEMNWFNIYEEYEDDSEEHIEALYFADYGYKKAQEALRKIKELDK